MPVSGADNRTEEFREIYFFMGLVLATWQRVEDEHVNLFGWLVSLANREIASLLYYSTESFESRRKIVNLIASQTLATSEQKCEWNEINRALKDANENRNKIAHYSVETNVENLTTGVDRSPIFNRGPPQLQPSPRHVVSRLQERLGPEHNLSPMRLAGYVSLFAALLDRMVRFRRTIVPMPRPDPSDAEGLLCRLSLRRLVLAGPCEGPCGGPCGVH